MQVESFALALAQILPVDGLPSHPATPLSGDGCGGRAGAAFCVRGGRVHAAAPPPVAAGAPAEPSGARGGAALAPRLRVVDFGSGSGNLTLPLAFAFPGLDVCGVDMKAEAVQRLRERAAAAGLDAVTAHAGTIEEYECDALRLLRTRHPHPRCRHTRAPLQRCARTARITALEP